MYNEGQDRGYNNGYDQGLLEGHDNGWDEAKEYYQKIFERGLREAKQAWKENANMEENGDEEENDEWSFYGQKKDSKQTESSDW